MTRCARGLRRASLLCAVAITLAGCQRPATTQAAEGDPAAFYRGRTVRILVGTSPGGGQDLYARLMAAHLSRHLAGHPAIIVENKTGAGGLIAADYLARRAAPDGLTIGLLGIQAVFEQLMNDSAHFDIGALPVIGSPADDGAVCAFARASRFSLDGWRRGRAPRMGMTNRGSTTASYAVLFTEALSLPLQPVVGYAGTSDIRAALASGEVDGVCLSRSSFLASFQPAEDYDVVLRSGGGSDADFPDVPSAESLVGTDRGRSLLDILATIGVLARYYALPSGTPEARIEAMRSAFELTMKDSSFLAAARTARLEIRPQPASAVTAHMRSLLTLPPAVRRDLVTLLKQGSR